MNKSDAINEISAALSKVQAKLQPAKKNAKNPFYNRNYADLTSVWDACRDLLSENGLCIIQTVEPDKDAIILETTLCHTSGQWISGKLQMFPVKSDPQAVGSCLSYARRYSLAAIIGICTEDDDGNIASGKMGDPRKDKYPVKESEKVQASREASEKDWKPGEGNASPTESKPPINDPKAIATPPSKEVPEEKGEFSWKHVVIPFTKHKGKKLGQLEQKSLHWFARVWLVEAEEKMKAGTEFNSVYKFFISALQQRNLESDKAKEAAQAGVQDHPPTEAQ